MITICHNGHRFEYLQDETTCREKKCGETSQHRPKRFGPGEREVLNRTIEAAMETQRLNQPKVEYERGYANGFEAGILAEDKRRRWKNA